MNIYPISKGTYDVISIIELPHIFVHVSQLTKHSISITHTMNITTLLFKINKDVYVSCSIYNKVTEDVYNLYKQLTSIAYVKKYDAEDDSNYIFVTLFTKRESLTTTLCLVVELTEIELATLLLEQLGH